MRGSRNRSKARCEGLSNRKRSCEGLSNRNQIHAVHLSKTTLVLRQQSPPSHPQFALLKSDPSHLHLQSTNVCRKGGMAACVPAVSHPACIPMSPLLAVRKRANFSVCWQIRAMVVALLHMLLGVLKSRSRMPFARVCNGFFMHSKPWSFLKDAVQGAAVADRPAQMLQKHRATLAGSFLG